MTYTSLIWQQVQQVWSQLPSNQSCCLEADTQLVWTFSTLFHAVQQIQNALLMQMQAGQEGPPRVAIIAHPGVDAVKAVLGTLAAGYAPALL